MTIVQERVQAQAVFDGRARTVAATLLVAAPSVMLLSFLVAALAERSAPGEQDAAVAVAAPTAAAIATMLDWLSVPLLLAWGAVLLLITRPWSRTAAWIGFVSLGLQACALASVVGMELLAAVLAQDGADPAALQHSFDEGLVANPAGAFLFVMFMGMEVVGLVAFGIALWRTRWAPRAVPLLMWAFPVVDLLTPNHPKIIHVVAFLVFLAAFVVLAQSVLRNGAPRPPAKEHTGRP